LDCGFWILVRGFWFAAGHLAFDLWHRSCVICYLAFVIRHPGFAIRVFPIPHSAFRIFRSASSVRISSLCRVDWCGGAARMASFCRLDSALVGPKSQHAND
jgi:hypothetical protein